MAAENDQDPVLPQKTGAHNSWDQVDVVRQSFGRFFADTAACARFFSRLPLPPVNSMDDPSAPPDFRRISRAMPLAGVLTAIPAASAGLLLGYTHLPSMAIGILVVTISAIVAGALHEDGLSDVADGFFGGYTVDRRLEIMKDSRIGAFGALALVLSIGLRVVLVGELWRRLGPADAALIYLSTEAISRLILVWQWQLHPLARPEGLAARFGKPGGGALSQATLLTAALLVPAAVVLPVSALAAGFLCTAIAGFALGRLALKKIGGVTGDVLGAIQQVSGLGFLIGLLMVP